jgi:hypothetical protein
MELTENVKLYTASKLCQGSLAMNHTQTTVILFLGIGVSLWLR